MNKTKHSWIIILIIAIVFMSCLIMFFAKDTPLPGYIDESSTAEPPITPVTVNLNIYTLPETKFSIGIPEGWQKVNRNGRVSFIHKASASTIEIEEVNYNPEITMMTKESASTSAIAAGYNFLEFYWIDNSSFAIIYTKGTNESVTNYIETVHFDRKNIIRVTYIIKGEHYQKLQATVEQSIDSIEWERKDPIPKEFILQYNSFGNFEFGSPIGWTSGITDGAYYAQDTQTGATMVITAVESDFTYEKVSQLDYVKTASRGRSNFALRSYAADKKIIRGTAVYAHNGQQYMMMQYLIASGTYEYSITFECPVSAYEQTQSLYENAIKLFRIF